MDECLRSARRISYLVVATAAALIALSLSPDRAAPYRAALEEVVRIERMRGELNAAARSLEREEDLRAGRPVSPLPRGLGLTEAELVVLGLSWSARGVIADSTVTRPVQRLSPADNGNQALASVARAMGLTPSSGLRATAARVTPRHVRLADIDSVLWADTSLLRIPDSIARVDSAPHSLWCLTRELPGECRYNGWGHEPTIEVDPGATFPKERLIVPVVFARNAPGRDDYLLVPARLHLVVTTAPAAWALLNLHRKAGDERGWPERADSRGLTAIEALSDDLLHRTPASAIRFLEARMEEASRQVTLLGINLNDRLALIGGPILLALTMLYLLFHLQHIRRMLAANHDAALAFPWSPIFARPAGSVSALALLLVLPTGAVLLLFLQRVRAGTLSVGGFALIVTTIAWLGAAINYRLWRIRRELHSAIPGDALASFWPEVWAGIRAGLREGMTATAPTDEPSALSDAEVERVVRSKWFDRAVRAPVLWRLIPGLDASTRAKLLPLLDQLHGRASDGPPIVTQSADEQRI